MCYQTSGCLWKHSHDVLGVLDLSVESETVKVLKFYSLANK